MSLISSQGRQAIAYDRRGHGRSTDPGTIGYDSLADDLLQVIESLELSNVTLVAHSGAAGEVIRYLTRHGDRRIANIVLVGATAPLMLHRPDNPDGIPVELLDSVLHRLEVDLPGWIEENAEPFAPGATRRTLDWLGDMLLGCSRRILVDFQRAIATEDFRDECTLLDVPVTLIHGDRDVSAPIELTANRLVRAIEGAELRVYAGAAHGLMLTHAPRLAKDLLAPSNA